MQSALCAVLIMFVRPSVTLVSSVEHIDVLLLSLDRSSTKDRAEIFHLDNPWSARPISGRINDDFRSYRDIIS